MKERTVLQGKLETESRKDIQRERKADRVDSRPTQRTPEEQE